MLGEEIHCSNIKRPAIHFFLQYQTGKYVRIKICLDFHSVANQSASSFHEIKPSINEDEEGYITANVHSNYLAVDDVQDTGNYCNQNVIDGARAMEDNASMEEYENIDVNYRL